MDPDLPKTEKNATTVIKIRRITDEHMTVIEHQLYQHLRDGDPTKHWGALSQAAEKCLTSIVQDDRKDKGRHRQRTTQNEILQSLTIGKGDQSGCSSLPVYVTAPTSRLNTFTKARRRLQYLETSLTSSGILAKSGTKPARS